MGSLLLPEQMGAEPCGALEGLGVLPGLDFFGVAAQQHVGHLPAVEFGRAGIDRRGQKAVLE